MKISTLWRAPEVNPITLKARSVPVLNPFNKYGRVFLFSWLGFMIAFWAWYTFPPLLTWSDRHLHVQENLQGHGIQENVLTDVVDVPGGIADRHSTPSPTAFDSEKNSTNDNKNTSKFENEATISRDEMLVTAQGETILKPTFKDGLNFPSLGQTGASNWAAMFGFLNVVTRPLGGIVGDVLYHFGKQNLWLKKGWVSFCGIMTGLLLILIGRLNPHDEATMFGLIFLMAVFHEAGNGANFALVPHVHPQANGIVSGLTGAGGNLGGIIFAIIFRFMDNGTNYAKGFWVIGCMHIGLNVLVSWIPPLPKGQIGGR
ncbi:Nitrate transporter like protein [Verticillium longisporum]|uniref:Nitrate transporter like protein n=1 Tax=Verticillium longisporum TaxID=100787 RepID=A0A8I2Z4Q7_VERLO|nr:Nitrate transporter like protein [Verticillium longisporum]